MNQYECRPETNEINFRQIVWNDPKGKTVKERKTERERERTKNWQIKGPFGYKQQFSIDENKKAINQNWQRSCVNKCFTNKHSI